MKKKTESHFGILLTQERWVDMQQWLDPRFVVNHHLGSDWFKRNGYGCGNLWMHVVAVSNGFKKFVRLIMRLEVDAFANTYDGLTTKCNSG